MFLIHDLNGFVLEDRDGIDLRGDLGTTKMIAGGQGRDRSW